MDLPILPSSHNFLTSACVSTDSEQFDFSVDWRDQESDSSSAHEASHSGKSDLSTSSGKFAHETQHISLSEKRRIDQTESFESIQLLALAADHLEQAYSFESASKMPRINPGATGMIMPTKSTDQLAPPEDNKARRLRKALTYTTLITNAFNEGNFEKIREVIAATCHPDCDMKSYVCKGQEPSILVRTVPPGQLTDFFLALMDGYPDGLWTIEESKVRKGKPVSVASRYRFTGTMMQTLHDSFVERVYPATNPNLPYSVIQFPSGGRIETRGTMILTLDSDYKVTNFAFQYMFV